MCMPIYGLLTGSLGYVLMGCVNRMVVLLLLNLLWGISTLLSRMSAALHPCSSEYSVFSSHPRQNSMSLTLPMIALLTRVLKNPNVNAVWISIFLMLDVFFSCIFFCSFALIFSFENCLFNEFTHSQIFILLFNIFNYRSLARNFLLYLQLVNDSPFYSSCLLLLFRTAITVDINCGYLLRCWKTFPNASAYPCTALSWYFHLAV